MVSINGQLCTFPTPKYGHYAWLVALCVFLAVPAKFLLPECQFSYMLYEIAYIYFLSVFRPAYGALLTLYEFDSEIFSIKIYIA